MAQLAKSLLDAQVAIKETEAKLKETRKTAMHLAEEAIPAAMQELGLQKLVLDTGQTIMVKQDVYASIPKANQQDAFRWLEQNDFGGLIKSVVKVYFDRGELEKAAGLVEQLDEQNQAHSFDERVHPQTLKAWLRERIAEGDDVPLELFGARPVFVATITK